MTLEPDLSTSTPTAETSAIADAAADQEDIRLSLAGDSEAYRRLIDRHQQQISRLMWRFTKDRRTHEELVQDVFVEAYLSLDTYKAKAPLAHWLARVATHVGYHFWKQKKRRQETEHFRIVDWDQAISDEQVDRLDPDEAARQLYDLLAQLPPRDRLVLTLRYLEQCDVAETARRTGWSKTMVKVQSNRARNKLKTLFKKSGREFEL